MTPDFLSRVIGLIVFGVLAARAGADPQTVSFVNLSAENSAVIFGMVGVLFGLIVTPWITVRPLRSLKRSITEAPPERLLLSLAGMTGGLMLGLLAAYPLSLLGDPVGTFAPTLVSLLLAYLGVTIFAMRSRELIDLIAARLSGRIAPRGTGSNLRLLVDTSSLIDGRIVDIAETGFLPGNLLVPRFVLNELHRVADSTDPLRRNRGRRGLAMLNKLQREDMAILRIIEDDVEEVSEVDHKLVALALQMDAAILTNDYNLGEVADAQGVAVLNINRLANAVRSAYIPGESFAIRIIQEGRDQNQGVGYLDDGTMVVVENGKSYMDRSINVVVTKLINRDTGRMIFAIPEHEVRRGDALPG